MGSGMAGRLLSAGFPLAVYNRKPEKAERLKSAGAFVARTPREAAARAEVVISMVADDVASRTVWLGEDGALAGVRYTINRRRAVAAAHQRIVDALRDHNGDAAADMMTQHLEEAGRYWSRKYGDLVADPVRWAH